MIHDLQELFGGLHTPIRLEVFFLLCRNFLRKIPFLVTLDIPVMRYISQFVKEQM